MNAIFATNASSFSGAKWGVQKVTVTERVNHTTNESILVGEECQTMTIL